MRQTLLRIPLDADFSFGVFTVPGFGFGLVLAIWLAFGGYWLYRNRGEKESLKTFLPVWVVVAILIVLLPDLVQRGVRAKIESITAMIESGSANASELELYERRGLLHAQIYEYDNAARDFQAMIEAAPQNDSGFLRLAWLKAACPEAEYRDGEEAVPLAKQALDLANPKTAVHWDTLATAEAEAGNFERAQSAIETAARSAEASADPMIRARLADIRNRLDLFEDDTAYRDPRFAQSFPQSLPIRGYGFMMFLGFITAGVTASRLARQVGIAPDVIWDLGIWTLLGGIVGARMFYLVQYHERVFKDVSGLGYLAVPFQLQEGGLVLLGGLIFGSGIFFAYCYFRRLKPLLMADIAFPAFFAALAFGRLGCLMNGCCYGDRCELPWAIEFPLGSVPDMALVFRGFIPPESTASMLLHPSQIYSSFNALVLAVLTAAYFRYRKRDGDVFAMGLLTYPITRFAIEYLRGDEMGKFGTSFTISQWVSAGLFSAGLLFLFWLRTRPAKVTPSVAQYDSEKAQTDAA